MKQKCCFFIESHSISPTSPGTQHIFEDDDTVLYVSIHRHDDGAFFPGNDDGDSDKIGVGRGAGFNLNVPWNTGNGRRSIGDASYLAAFLEAVLPVATQFDPDLVLVSAGFDAAMGDPLGRCQVTPMAYALMTRYLSVLAEGRVILALEGGYNLKSIAECMTACGAALLGCPLPRLEACITEIVRPWIKSRTSYELIGPCWTVELNGRVRRRRKRNRQKKRRQQKWMTKAPSPPLRT